MKRALHWFRRDLRIHDNTALFEACRQAEQVVPVFILEDAFRTGPDVGAARLSFLLRSLHELRQSLRELGANLVVRLGRSEIELPKLAQELNAQVVFCNTRYEPYAQLRDSKVFNALNQIGIGFESFKDAALWHEQEILTQAGRPFTVFTPYSRVWKSRATALPRPPIDLSKLRLAEAIPSDELPLAPAALGHPCTQTILAVGERAALTALDNFMREKIFTYAEARNRADIEGTSQLSAHLRAGTIGIRDVTVRVHRRQLMRKMGAKSVAELVRITDQLRSEGIDL